MGADQILKIKNTIQALAFPGLLAIVVWFGAIYFNRLEKNSDVLMDIKLDIKDIKNGLEYNNKDDIRRDQEIEKINQKLNRQLEIRQAENK